jgi:hypothetical protein
VGQYPNPRIESVPLSIFPILLLGLAGILFVLAAVLPPSRDGIDYRFRLFSFGLFCWVVFALLQLIGGLIK